MTTAYCTATELRSQIDKVGVTGPASDAALDVLIKAASQVVDRYFNRPDGWFVADAIPAARLFGGNGKAHLLINECISITKVEVKDSPTDTAYVTWTSGTDYLPFSGDPLFPDFNSLPYDSLMVIPDGSYSVFTSGLFGTPRGFRVHPDDTPARNVPTVRVTSRWGYSAAAPAAVKEAVIAMSARWMKRGQSSWADAVAAAEMGTMLYSSREWNDIKAMLESLRLHKPTIGRR